MTFLVFLNKTFVLRIRFKAIEKKYDGYLNKSGVSMMLRTMENSLK